MNGSSSKALLGALAALLLLCVARWAFTLSLPGALSFDEVQLVSVAWHWRQGALPYADPYQPPAIFNPYGPVPTWLLARSTAVGLSPWLAVRLWSLLPTLAILVVGAAVLRRRHQGGRMLFVLTALALASRPVFWIAMRGRVDGLAAALAVGGFLCAVYGSGRTSAVSSGILMALATLTKMNMVAAPLAALMALRGERPRRARAVLGLWLLLTGLAVAGLHMATDGAYLASLRRPISHPLRPFEMAFRTITTTAPWLWWTLRVWLGLPPEQRRACYAWCWYAWLALLVGSASSAMQGASWNYLFEFYVVLALAAARLWATRPAARLTWWLVGQATLSTIMLAAVLDPRAEAGAQQQARQAALARLAPLVAGGQRVAVYGNHGAAEALYELGHPNGLDIVDGLVLDRATTDRLAARALASGRVDLVLHGPHLVPWRAASPPDHKLD